MARSYARITVDLWSDEEYLRLSRDAMLFYQFLLEQPKMRTCGVIDMRVRQWATKLRMTTSEIDRTLAELAETGFITVDDDTAELAVRTFISHDIGFRTTNWKVWSGVWASLKQVESERLRKVIAANLPDAAYEPESNPNHRRIDHQSVTEEVPNRSPIDHQSITDPIPDRSTLTLTTTTTVADPTETTTVVPLVTSPGGGGPDRVTEAIEALADAEPQPTHPPSNPAAYRRAIVKRLRGERELELTRLAKTEPDLSGQQLAERMLESKPIPPLRPIPASESDAVRDTRRGPDACPACQGTGWTTTKTGDAIACPACQGAA